jgi:ABC-type glycerol-3-phosphate transport system substrate-binding protein
MSARLYRRYAALALVTTVGLSMAACSSSNDSKSANSKVTITVDCPPLKTDNKGKSLEQWNNDVAAFEKANPNIVIKSISVGAQCDNPADFTARLQGGTAADVFYGYMTDLNQVLDQDAAADITQYLTKDNVPSWDQIADLVKKPFVDNGKIYGLGYGAYSMGLVYNKTLFKQAGLPDKAPTTWAEVATDAKAIAALGPDYVGYEEYSAGNTGGWHFTTQIYARGGADVDPTGKTATVNTPEGHDVLSTLHDMRWNDNSMGVKQLKQCADLLTDAGAGKVGMYLGAPDTITAIVTMFKGKYEDWAMGALPGKDGAAKATLGGGSGYFFNKHDTPEQIAAGLKFVSFEKLTPGMGALNYAFQKSIELPVGQPEPIIFTSGSALDKQDLDLKKANTNLDLTAYSAYVENPVAVNGEPPHAQEIYAVLDGAMSAVLTQKDANIDELLKKANDQIQSILDKG